MERRKFVIGMGALATGSAAAVGTGAVSSNTKFGRDVTVSVVDDDQGVLGLSPGQDGNFAEIRNDGQLAITFETDYANGANPEAKHRVGDLFEITNQGTEDVDVSIQKGSSGEPTVDGLNKPGRMKFYSMDGDGDHFPKGQASGDITGQDNRFDEGGFVTLGVGDSVSVSVEIDTTGLSSGDEIGGDIGVTAEGSIPTP